MSNTNLTPEQIQKLGSHLQKEAQNGFEVRPLAPQMPIIESSRQEEIIQPVYTPIVENQQQPMSLEEKIKRFEAEYKGGLSIPKQSETMASSYLDEYGRDTFYVKNISGNKIHLQLSKEPESSGILIPKGFVVNLLESATIEECLTSKDLNKLLMGFVNDPPALKRITKQEYADEMEKFILTNRKIEEQKRQESLRQRQMTQAQNQNQMQQNMPFQNPVRQEVASKPNYKIMSKIEKLRLSTAVDQEDAKFGITSAEFIQWMWQEYLSDEDLDYIMGDPIVMKFPEVKHAAIEKKTIK